MRAVVCKLGVKTNVLGTKSGDIRTATAGTKNVLVLWKTSVSGAIVYFRKSINYDCLFMKQLPIAKNWKLFFLVMYFLFVMFDGAIFNPKFLYHFKCPNV